ncbi:NADH-quinone oxidoreductase subunit J [uncultured Thiocystis sp.]|jgi:NADH-quinone oxidoreductase subunit J|uniref:NADH-quinone oxidoreductase subunit J n=1 Tax=uncultured Thiocystis sp. TaxID=1202134 RepID=UPI0025D6B67B|nr:NADH-quinone oxidoreductase subunit J [uncultured Thiocystis sp.]
MGFEKFLFYVFALITLWAAGMVITRRNPVHAVLFLVLAFVTSAALWILLEAEFLGIVLILVYVGAVMVLFLFVVMMLDVDIATLRAGFIRYLPLGALVTVVMAIEMFLVVGPANFGLDAFPAPAPLGADVSNTRELGLLLYTVYLYPVEIASVILLVAIVAAIRLTLRHRPDTKYIDPSRQVSVKKGPDRIRIVKMATEDQVPMPALAGGHSQDKEETE